MWSMVAQRLTQITPPAAPPDQLWQRVEVAWFAVPQEHIQSLFESMPRCGGQLDEWKWDCHRLMLLDVSMCLVVLFSDFGINKSEDSVSRRPVLGRPRATTPAEDRFLALSARRRRTTTVPQLVADHFQHQEEESPLLRCEIVFIMQVCMQEDQLCAFPQRTTKVMLNIGLLCCSDESRFTMESDSGRLLIWRNNAL
ncbi:uncharacterized protein TNCV_2674641 [Trichonephila clavipes]|nr:uncharacterized protein TNCV_2674641 [Trichonephila clavipes]